MKKQRQKIIGTTDKLLPELFGLPPGTKEEIKAPLGFVWQIAERDLGRKTTVLKKYFRIIPDVNIKPTIDVVELISRFPARWKMASEYSEILEMKKNVGSLTDQEIKTAINLFYAPQTIWNNCLATWNTLLKEQEWLKFVAYYRSLTAAFENVTTYKVNDEIFWFYSGPSERAFSQQNLQTVCWDSRSREYKNQNWRKRINEIWANRKLPDFDDFAKEGDMEFILQYQMQTSEYIERLRDCIAQMNNIANKMVNDTDINTLSASKTKELERALMKAQKVFLDVENKVTKIG